MNKFWTVVLKFLIVISFLGIVAFVGIAIFNNQNISYEAYNYIESNMQETDFQQLQNDIRAKVKVSYGGASDSYANFINSAIIELNEGINYYNDYLAVENNILKGEQDKLIELFDDYVGAFNLTVEAYNVYTQAYEYARIQIEEAHEQSDYAQANLNAKGAYLVKTYVNCYVCGSKLFKNLAKIVDKYSLFNTHLFSYKLQSYMIKNGMVDYSLDFVVENMNKRINDNAYSASASSFKLIEKFYDYLNNETKYYDSEVLTNENFKTFKNDLNCLDIYEWAGNYSNYLIQLKEDLRAKASFAYTFFNNGKF